MPLAQHGGTWAGPAGGAGEYGGSPEVCEPGAELGLEDSEPRLSESSLLGSEGSPKQLRGCLVSLIKLLRDPSNFVTEQREGSIDTEPGLQSPGERPSKGQRMQA